MPKYSFRKLKEKKIRLSESRGKRMAYYFAGALLCSLLVLAGTLLDSAMNTRVIAAVVKLTLAGLCLVLARQSGYLRLEDDGKITAPLLIAALLPLLFYGLYLGPFESTAEPAALIGSLIGVLTAALWEEAYFRLWAGILFEEDGKYRVGEFLLTALIFSMMHLVNLFSAGLPDVMMQAAYALIYAVFIQTVYAAGRSLRLIVLQHALNNVLLLLIQTGVPDPSARFFGALGNWTPVFSGLCMAVTAAVLTRRHGLIRRPASSSSPRRRKASDKRR